MIKVVYEDLNLDEIKDFPGNPQSVSKEKMKMMTANMRRDGWYGQMPVVWYNHEEDEYYYISGHHRAKCALSAGIKKRKCEIINDSSVTWDKARKALLMFNNLHGTPDKELEKSVIEQILCEAEELDTISEEIGRSEKQIDDILKSIEPDIDNDIETKYEIVVECESEEKQEELYDYLVKEGYKCRVSTL